MARSLCSRETQGPLLSGEVDMATYLHAQGFSVNFTIVSGFLRHMLSDQDPVGISLPTHEV